MRHASRLAKSQENSIGNFFLGRAIKIGDVNSVSAFESDATVAGKCCDGGNDQDQREDDDFFSWHCEGKKKGRNQRDAKDH